jgi:Putative auto-transporter adhesin, head GIN domain
MKNIFWAFSLLISIFSLASCYRDDSEIVTELRQVRNFHALKVEGAAEVSVRVGNEYRVEVTTAENDMDQIRTVEQNGVLVITQVGPDFRIGDQSKVVVVAPFWDGFYVSGANDVEVADPIKGTRLDISTSGSGDLTILKAEYGTIHIQQNGSSNVNLSGSCNEMNVNLSGSADLQALNCPVATAFTELYGTSSAKINVSTLLQAKVGGSAEVRYKGNPEVRSQVSSSGRVIKI